jgi:PncC family amidohydrolase
MFPEHLVTQASHILETCKAKGLKLSCAESCTGGLLSALFTEIAGSSAVFEGGFVSYSNMMKQLFLNVRSDSLAECGAVSERVAMEMASHCRSVTRTDISIGITGIAGPEGGTPDKPVGLVYIGISTENHAQVERHLYQGNRTEVRIQAVESALVLISTVLK